ncbi:flagellar biosynthesis anti-sigma factor FlgM [Wukongibacter baidiensis]|uniref:flagellar biosynthesis anti-sigma factor FlgM n=1 Tax=Wukongibacter baidiensis TaxID=1723361 RepID=UPI003D7F8193
MKIFNNPNVQKVMGAYQSKTAKTQKSKQASGAKDKIEFSSMAKDFQVAMNAFKKLPETREAKIGEVKAAIASGTYNPSAEEAVEKIVEGVNFDKKI